MDTHILIVEDNEDLLQLMTEALLSEGYRVRALVHCDNIIDAVIDSRADIVILDFLLLGINGGELCHQIKTNSVTCNLPVMIISGYPRVLESLGHYGSDRFLAKPFLISQLVFAVNALIPSHLSVAAFV